MFIALLFQCKPKVSVVIFRFGFAGSPVCFKVDFPFSSFVCCKMSCMKCMNHRQPIEKVTERNHKCPFAKCVCEVCKTVDGIADDDDDLGFLAFYEKLVSKLCCQKPYSLRGSVGFEKENSCRAGAFFGNHEKSWR